MDPQFTINNITLEQAYCDSVRTNLNNQTVYLGGKYACNGESKENILGVNSRGYFCSSSANFSPNGSTEHSANSFTLALGALGLMFISTFKAISS